MNSLSGYSYLFMQSGSYMYKFSIPAASGGFSLNSLKLKTGNLIVSQGGPVTVYYNGSKKGTVNVEYDMDLA